MSYLPSLGLVFVAIPKTGSTSMNRALRRAYEPQGKVQLLKEKIDAEFRARYRLNEIGDKKPGHAKHLSALQLKYVLGSEEFERCTKFSVVRNPWAIMVSRYFFTHVDAEPTLAQKLKRNTTRKFHRQAFEPWIERVWAKHKLGREHNSQLAKLVDLDGKLLVDHVGRLENIQATLEWVSEKVAIGPLTMPHINGTHKGHYSQFYTQATKDMVAEICRRDIDYFGYEFEEKSSSA